MVQGLGSDDDDTCVYPSTRADSEKHQHPSTFDYIEHYKAYFSERARDTCVDPDTK